MHFTNLSDLSENNPGISSLNQGSKFNGMQANIVTSALPGISLLEKTTMPGIISMKEPLANMNKGPKTSTDKYPLQQMDKDEFKKLDDLETQFSKKLTEYVTVFKSRSADLMSKSNTDEQTNFYLEHLNDQLMTLSDQMWEQTKKIHSSDIKIQEQITKKREKLNDNISKLNSHRAQFTQLDDLHSTLDGQLQDNRLRNDSAYIQYLVWFVAATTIGAIAIHKSL
tara:strand:- start:1061 stop:1735 length:675 start_codon:yes stop_codon:yes gene_type:complete